MPPVRFPTARWLQRRLSPHCEVGVKLLEKSHVFPPDLVQHVVHQEVLSSALRLPTRAKGACTPTLVIIAWLPRKRGEGHPSSRATFGCYPDAPAPPRNL